MYQGAIYSIYTSTTSMSYIGVDFVDRNVYGLINIAFPISCGNKIPNYSMVGAHGQYCYIVRYILLRLIISTKWLLLCLS